MINKIIDGISESLYAEFGDGYDINIESIPQGFEEPCFFINCLNPTNELYLGKRYKRTNQFMIQYFPSSKKPKRECFDVQERLYHCLEVIDVGGHLTRGTGINGALVDGVLNFEINYDMFMYEVESLEDMGDYSLDSRVRED